MIGRAWVWSNETDARTWAVHAAIAVALSVVLSPAIAVSFYALREVEQVVNKLARKQKLHPLDHLMDVLAPALAVAPLWLLG